MTPWPAAGAILLAVGAAVPAASEDCTPRVREDPAALRAVVVIAGEDDPAVLRSVAELGANLVATQTAPRAATAAAASAAGLGYLPRVSMRDVDRLVRDSEYRRQVRAMPAIAGFHYIDLDVIEGFALPSTQALAYGTLKALFPDRLVLYATRLDPIGTQPDYLPAYYRPEFTDFVTPYFYPVGTTPLGVFEERDPWEKRLRLLLSPLAAATPPGKPLLPVLQAFEQIGHPAGGGLPRRQLEVYREFWPDSPNVAVFWWGGPIGEPLAGLADLPRMARGVAGLFGAAPGRPLPCAVAPRGLTAPEEAPRAGSSTDAASTRRVRRPGGS